MHSHCTRLKTSVLVYTLLLVQACADPVDPEFEYILGLPYIDAVVGTAPGTSYVKISKSAREFDVNLNTPVKGATVFFINTGNGNTVALTEEEDSYLPTYDFAASEGQTWELWVLMPDGKEYRSEPEKIPPAVVVSGYQVSYNPELRYDEGMDSNIPGHRISVDFQDPPGVANFYYWRYRSFERLVNCRECYGKTVLREDECIGFNHQSEIILLKDYYTYACEQRCWEIRYSDKISIFSDEFTEGRPVKALPVADVVLYTKRNILVELQQFSISPGAYRYLKTLTDLIDNNSGFNAPLPAALVGNLYNPTDPDEVVLGRLTAAATTVSPIFIERSDLLEESLETVLTSQPEGEEAPAPLVTTAPCIEGQYRTSIQPIGWQDL